MGIFNNLNKYTNVDISEYIKNITQKIQAGSGLKLDANNNYDIENSKLTNVAEGTTYSDAITKNQLDAAIGNKHDNDQNIDLKDTYNVINSKQQTFSEMNANRNTLLCYEDLRNVFVSRKESVFPMQTHLNMGTNYIYVKTPINNDQGVNKSYADTKLSLSGGVMQGNLDMNNNRIYNLAQPNGNNQPATKN